MRRVCQREVCIRRHYELAPFGSSLGGLYLIALVWLVSRRGWSTAAFFAGLLHVVFATTNSAAPFRALVDSMYVGWQVGLTRFEGRAAFAPAAIVLLWALASAWLCAQRPATRWMRLVAWGDLFWLTNITAALLIALFSNGFQQAKIQFGQYFQVSGVWVGVSLLLAIPLVFGSSALWAYRQTLSSESSAS